MIDALFRSFINFTGRQRMKIVGLSDLRPISVLQYVITRGIQEEIKEMVTLEQVFLPYMMVKGERTLYEAIKDKGFYLTEGDKSGE